MPDQTAAQKLIAPRCDAVGPDTGDPCIGVAGHGGGHPFAPPGRPIHAAALAWLLDSTKMPRHQVWAAPPADAAPGPGKPLTVALAEKITASQRAYEKLSVESWEVLAVDTAVRYRGMAEGLAMALDHLLAVVAEHEALKE